jgi:cob(I)alamin adenosyltransferase
LKIYTKTGDEGSTGLFGGGRVSKHHPRVSAYGTVDELNAQIGVALTLVEEPELRKRLGLLQHDLFRIGAILATPPAEGDRPVPELPALPAGRIEEMERWIDGADETLEPLREFVLPGGSPGAAALHVCRTVCRRAEREVVHLAELDAVDGMLIRYLNRLSDLLFTMAREENARRGVGDVTWSKDEA